MCLVICYSCHKDKSCEISVEGASIVIDTSNEESIKGLRILLQSNAICNMDSTKFSIIYCSQNKCKKIPMRLQNVDTQVKSGKYYPIDKYYVIISDLYELYQFAELLDFEVNPNFMQYFLCNIILIKEQEGNLSGVEIPKNLGYRFMSDSIPTKVIKID